MKYKGVKGMIKGYVLNSTGKYKHIYKRSVGPGQRVDIFDLYSLYEKKFDGPFGLDFVKWLEENKTPPGFDLVIDEYDEENEIVPAVEKVEKTIELKVEEVAKKVEREPTRKRRIIPNKLTHIEIANLKIKDNPKEVIAQVQSVHKLRRALTECKGKKGKGTLMKYIRIRIDQLK